MGKASRHYVNNKQLHAEMLAYHEKLAEAEKNGTDKPIPSKYIGECIMFIARRYATKFRFVNYPFRDEMELDGIENCVLYGIDNFNPHKYNNPFAYFTQIIDHAFIRRIKKEKKYLYTKIRQIQNHDLSEQLVNNNYNPSVKENTDNMNAYVRDFEDSLRKEKEKKQKSKGLEKFYDDEDKPVTKKRGRAKKGS
jgi:hypothetical protein